MRTRRPDFGSKETRESYYDLHEDWSLIEASLATQYGIRIRSESGSMPFSEFLTLVSGLMPETPLGKIVAIRSEKDQKAIKAFSPDQKRIHSEWRKRSAAKQLEDPENLDKQMEQLSKMLGAMFGKKGGN